MKQRIEWLQQQLALAKETLDREREREKQEDCTNQMDGFHPASVDTEDTNVPIQRTPGSVVRANAFVASLHLSVGEH
eukprot:3359082-Prorocentrum_lima.AAC.1